LDVLQNTGQKTDLNKDITNTNKHNPENQTTQNTAEEN